MKPLTLILLGSVILNAALGISYTLRVRSQPIPEAAGQPAASTRGNGTAAEIWAEIDTSTSSDPAALIARLRAEKFPPEIIRAIVTARLREEFMAKYRALGEPNDNREYWKSYASRRSDTAETRASQRKLQREYAEQVRQLLGEDTSLTWEKAVNERQYGSLSSDKIEQVKLITQDYNDLKSQVQAEAKGVLLAEDREKLAYLDREQKADLAQILTPEEIEQYELRNSRTANQLKARLNLFDATEQEYVTLYRLQKSFDERFPGDGFYSFAPSQEQMRARSESQQQLTRDIEAALGPERFREYRIKTDNDYRQVSALAERLKLPDNAAVEVVTLKLETQDRVRSLLTQPPKGMAEKDAREQIQTQLGAMTEEVATRLEHALGPEGYAAYKDRAKNWIPTFRSSKN